MPNSTPATDSRPSSVPRPLMTPAPQTRENSVVSAPADSVMDEADHVIILKHCYDQRKSFKDGSKAQFWSSVKSAFIRDTGKTSAQISEIVSRLIEERRREIVDWENGFISQKPGGQVNEMLDQWIEYIKTENADIEENGMEWLDAAKKVLDADKLDQYDSSKIPHGQSGISTENQKTTPTANSSRGRIPYEEWDGHRALIKQLYIDEDRTLREVIRILGERHGFHASEKQFKSKLKAWKFEKNVSTSEMQFMIRKRHDRKEIGKPTVFRMSGQIVDEDKIERFARKHSVYEVAAREKTPENIQYDTPEELEEDEERIATAGTPPHLDHSTSLSRPGQRQAAITSYGSNAIPSTNMVSSNAMTANAKRPNFAEILPNPLVNNGNSEYIGPGQLHCFASPGIECYCVSCVAARDKDFTSELLPTLAGLSPNKRDLAQFDFTSRPSDRSHDNFLAASSRSPSTTSTKATREKRRSHPRESLSRNSASISTPSSIAAIDTNTFLEAQAILNKALSHGKPLSDTKKESLATFLEISTTQLEFCIKAQQDLAPMLDSLASKAQSYGLSTDQVARWFNQIGSYGQSREPAPLRDSAYQSSDAPRQQPPLKKRRKIVRDANPSRVYQCTHIADNGRRCLQENPNFTDWKRHEEIHWPQRRWECLIEGFSPNIACHVCGEYIDLNVEQYQQDHAGCFSRMPRKGHEFPRKDKLAYHVKQEHGYMPKLDAWQYPISSHWQRQCGFCGTTFSNWDDRCDHVGMHFVEGKRMVQDWRDPWPTEENDPDPEDDPDNDEDVETATSRVVPTPSRDSALSCAPSAAWSGQGFLHLQHDMRNPRSSAPPTFQPPPRDPGPGKQSVLDRESIQEQGS